MKNESTHHYRTVVVVAFYCGRWTVRYSAIVEAYKSRCPLRLWLAFVCLHISAFSRKQHAFYFKIYALENQKVLDIWRKCFAIILLLVTLVFFRHFLGTLKYLLWGSSGGICGDGLINQHSLALWLPVVFVSICHLPPTVLASLSFHQNNPLHPVLHFIFGGTCMLWICTDKYTVEQHLFCTVQLEMYCCMIVMAFLSHDDGSFLQTGPQAVGISFLSLLWLFSMDIYLMSVTCAPYKCKLSHSQATWVMATSTSQS